MTRLLRYRHDGLTFDVRDEGPLDGDPVVLLHGFPERSTCWRDVAPLLHAQGLRTYAPDQRGYSPGARPPRRRDYTMAQARGRRGRADRDHRRAGAPRRPRLGRQLRLAGRGAPARPGPHLDRGLGAAPGGVPQGDVLQPPGVLVVVHGRLPDAAPARAAGRPARRPVRQGAAQRRDDPGGRRPVPPRDRGVRRAARRAELVPRDALHPPARASPTRSTCRPRWCGATATSRSSGSPSTDAPSTSPAPTSSGSSRASATGSRPRRREAVADAILSRIGSVA